VLAAIVALVTTPGLAATAGELLPPSRSPVDPPTATALKLDDLTRHAIALFDAGPKSNRNYDLVECLDGLTFGFANMPQSNLYGFMSRMASDRDGATLHIFASRMAEQFRSDDAAWAAFVARAKEPAGERSEAVVLDGLRHTLLDRDFMRPYARRFNNHMESSTHCTPDNPPAGTRSFFDDHDAWFRPAGSFALRDSEVVDFQVRDWRKEYLDKGIKAAQELGVPGDAGSILLTFVMSNPGEVNKPARDYLVGGKAPEAFTIAHRDWRWDGTNRPLKLAKTSLESWHLLLVWQVMCDGRPRIRNRNIAFFRDFLASHFVLPTMTGQLPRDAPKTNCNPQLVSPTVTRASSRESPCAPAARVYEWRAGDPVTRPGHQCRFPHPV
jgi:hypothetical protein